MVNKIIIKYLLFIKYFAVLLPGESIDGNKIYFEIISTKTIEKNDDENKHVVYVIRIRHFSGKYDVNPGIIERRYTHFSTLYTSLRDAFPELMSSITFPKKVHNYLKSGFIKVIIVINFYFRPLLAILMINL